MKKNCVWISKKYIVCIENALHDVFILIFYLLCSFYKLKGGNDKQIRYESFAAQVLARCQNM